jgi:5-oxopent-3-ene-1,2,5-tricarboxylate decarboxylase / 2-hydroxyhepta-2,4-diene-1,7-dioate isomerase
MHLLSSLPEFDVAPYRLSGVVYGTLFNHAPAVQALGEAVNAAPYKAAPRAPVLYLKPRNTLSFNGSVVTVPADTSELEVGAALGIVIGQTACRMSPEQAFQFVAGYTIVNDISVPHDVFYRPSIRFKARDGFCPVGPVVVPRAAISDPDDLVVQVFVDGELQQQTTTGQRLRNVARLLADVTEFMTLLPGDVLMLGVSSGAPRVRAGQQSRIVIEGIGELVNHFVTEGHTA